MYILPMYNTHIHHNLVHLRRTQGNIRLHIMFETILYTHNPVCKIVYRSQI